MQKLRQTLRSLRGQHNAVVQRRNTCRKVTFTVVQRNSPPGYAPRNLHSRLAASEQPWILAVGNAIGKIDKCNRFGTCTPKVPVHFLRCVTWSPGTRGLRGGTTRGHRRPLAHPSAHKPPVTLMCPGEGTCKCMPVLFERRWLTDPLSTCIIFRRPAGPLSGSPSQSALGCLTRAAAGQLARDNLGSTHRNAARALHAAAERGDLDTVCDNMSMSVSNAPRHQGRYMYRRENRGQLFRSGSTVS